MTRILYSNPNPGGTPQLSSSSSAAAAAAPPQPLAVDSDIMVILAALLCALICVVGLALAARCAFLRRSNSPSSLAPPPPAKGLKKKALRALAKETFRPSCHAKLAAECPICLAEFADGDEIRVLPQCGHGFHVGCVDTWLGSHSSCPSCRTVLVVEAAADPGAARCQKCGLSSVAGVGEAGAKAREDRGDADRFLP